MKRYIYLAFSLATLTACSLDKDPISEFNEKNTTTEGKSSSAIENKAQMKTRYEALYAFVRGSAQEFWTLDFLQNTETRADNAYAGTSGVAITSIEQNSQDASNGNIKRDWQKYLEGINLANVVIANVDKVPDASLTTTERKQWKAEAKILKAWLLFDMVRFWGAVPIPPIEVPEISSENVEETYKLLFPERTSVAEVYNIIRTPTLRRLSSMLLL